MIEDDWSVWSGRKSAIAGDAVYDLEYFRKPPRAGRSLFIQSVRRLALCLRITSSAAPDSSSKLPRSAAPASKLADTRSANKVWGEKWMQASDLGSSEGLCWVSQ